MTTINTNLLPHLIGWEDAEPTQPWQFGYPSPRTRLLNALPNRVMPLVLCEYATSVLPVWRRYSTIDDRPQRAIAARLIWCRTGMLLHVDVAGAAYVDSAHAADTTRAADVLFAARAARAADAAGAVHVATAATAANAANATDAANAVGVQWAWMQAVYESSRSVTWLPEWNISTVIDLCNAIWDAPFGERHLYGVLADALQDAGCDNDTMLNRLRSERGPHTRADVAVWMPLGLGEPL